MEVIGKTINYIKLHDFLDRIEVEKVYSSLHIVCNTLTASLKSQETVEWSGVTYTKKTLANALKEEEGTLTDLNISRRSLGKVDVTIRFSSGNELVVTVKEQTQLAQIIQYLFEY